MSLCDNKQIQEMNLIKLEIITHMLMYLDIILFQVINIPQAIGCGEGFVLVQYEFLLLSFKA